MGRASQVNKRLADGDARLHGLALGFIVMDYGKPPCILYEPGATRWWLSTGNRGLE